MDNAARTTGTEFVNQSHGTGISLVHSERRGTAATGSWRLQDIDWTFCFQAQHYGTAFLAVFIILALAIIHWTAHPAQRPFFLYDASISYVSLHGDIVPAAAAVLCPFASLLLSLVVYEFFIYRHENWHITNAMASLAHFLLDASAPSSLWSASRRLPRCVLGD